MQVKVNEVQAASNRTMEIANLYHKQSLELINLALTHNKQAIDASHHRATELWHSPKSLDSFHSAV